MRKPLGKRYTGARATSNRVREALMDILMGEIEGSRFLDLYAGSGGVGMEALRRGASHVTFVEQNRNASEEIRKRIQKYGLSGRSCIMRKKATSFLSGYASGEGFDIVFLDPPYHSDEIFIALRMIPSSGIMKNDTTVIAEHFSGKELPERFDKLIKIRDYHYGDTVLSVFRMEGNESS